MATSFDALEALLQFREGPAFKFKRRRTHSVVQPALPVPNPLDPSQPHLIEGDATSPVVSRPASGSYLDAAFFLPNLPACEPVACSSVPDPLATPVAVKAPQHALAPLPTVSAAKALSTPSSHSMVATHGFGMDPTAIPLPVLSSGDVKPKQLLEVELGSDKIRDALNSKPQRGKKRQNLSELERQELTRTRNREHAKSTRTKKKARLMELMDIEEKFLFLKERESLDLCRRQGLVDLIETAGNRPELKACPHSSHLSQLASQEFQKAQFSVTDSVALTAENSGTVKVSVHGTDVESGKSKTLLGVISVDFSPGSTDICDVSLYWSWPKNKRVGIVPSISVLSFDHDN